MPKQIPVPTELGKPFWDAANEKKLVVQNCSSCGTLHYPPKQSCDPRQRLLVNGHRHRIVAPLCCRW